MKRQVALVLAVLLVLGLIVSWFVGGALMAPKPRVIGEPPYDLPAEPITLESESGSSLAGWHLPHPAPCGAIILLHGYRESRHTMIPRARQLHASGYAIIMIDFQAHGESSGEQVTIGHRERHDARAAVAFARASYPEAKLAVLGASMGGAAALYASPLDIDALVIESVYTRMDHAIHNRVAERLGPLSWLPAELLLLQFRPRIGVSPAQLCPIDHIADVVCPILVVSGAEDPHTPASETETLFAAASEPKQLWLVPDAGHEDLRKAAGTAYDQRLGDFLDTHLCQTAGILATPNQND
jgi:fermentation-respiration switch protein FrsA (DUF1100 family)